MQIELTADQQSRLASSIGDARITHGAAIGGAEIVFGNPEPDEIATAEQLRWVQLESVGFGEYLELDWENLKNEVTLTNLAGFFADPVAESALAGILALARGIDRLAVLQERREWVGDPLRTELRLIGGSRVTLLGRGSINRRLAELLGPFGAKVTLLGRDTASDRLDRELRVTDIFVAAVPDTPETRGLMDAGRIGNLPPSAVFVNLGRGSLVDEPALVKALASGQLAGAVLDVTENEPLAPDDPLWACPNTILTQHTGGGAEDEIDRKIDHFLANLARFRRGELLDGVVDMKRGY